MKDFSDVKARLELKLKELVERAEEIDDDLSQPGDDDSNENAIESEDDDVLEAVGAVTTKEIREVKFALAQIEAGKYGICTSCGAAIAKERLQAIPFLTRCVKCA